MTRLLNVSILILILSGCSAGNGNAVASNPGSGTTASQTHAQLRVASMGATQTIQVFTLSNQSDRNSALKFQQAANGKLVLVGSFDTHGEGNPMQRRRHNRRLLARSLTKVNAFGRQAL